MTEGDDIRIEPTQKRIRAFLGGAPVIDSDRALLVWEKPYYPTYYVPVADVADAVLTETGRSTELSPDLGAATLYTVKTSGGKAVDAAARFHDSRLAELRDTVRLEFASMDAWFEEDEQIYVHPRDPYTRIDVLRSSRHVEISVDGLTIATSDRPVFLFETGLPRRTYLPKTDVRMDVLESSDHHTECPYKGTASYYHVRTDVGLHENLAWWYPFPAHESAGIAGLVCFYDERVDIDIDGVRQQRPVTHFA